MDPEKLRQRQVVRGNAVLAALTVGLLVGLETHFLHIENVVVALVGGALGVLVVSVWKRTKPS